MLLVLVGVVTVARNTPHGHAGPPKPATEEPAGESPGHE